MLQTQTIEKSTLCPRVLMLQTQTIEKSRLCPRVLMLQPHTIEKCRLCPRVLMLQLQTIEKSRLCPRVLMLQTQTYSERLKYLNQHSLKGRRVRGDLIEAYKLYHGLVDIEWDNFTAPPYSHTRNATGKVFLQRSNTNLRKYCFSNRVANHWNNLSSQLKKCPKY
jgi:transposase